MFLIPIIKKASSAFTELAFFLSEPNKSLFRMINPLIRLIFG